MKDLSPPTKDLMPATILNSLPGWADLDAKTKATLEMETQQLGLALSNLGFSRLAVGEHLFNLQELLVPLRMFGKYIEATRLKRSTANTYIQGWRNAQELLPESVLRVAMARNFNMLGNDEEKPLGVYTDIVKRNPPPKTDEPRRISAWLDEIEVSRKRREANEVPRKSNSDPQLVTKILYRYINLQLNKLPRNNRTRKTCLENAVGMVLADMGISAGVSITPQAAPKDFKPVVGRPKIIDQDAA